MVDFPHSTRAKKYYLVLMVGQAAHLPSARGLNGEGEEEYEARVGAGRRAVAAGQPAPRGRVLCACVASPQQCAAAAVPCAAQRTQPCCAAAAPGLSSRPAPCRLLPAAQVTARERSHKRHKSGKQGKGRDWVLKKKDQMRRKGYAHIPSDTKYTGRKRKHLT